MTQRRCTYRLQLSSNFGFDEAASVARYLAALGISHMYTSPYLQAASGSTHGYDVVNHGRVSDELGGVEGHHRFTDVIKALDLGHMIDIVPNHMAIPGRENALWWDVLENGPSSVYADWFDVEWDPPEARLRNTVLMPVLGDHYGRVLDAGEIKLELQDAAVLVRYHDHVLPVEPRSLASLLETAAEGTGPSELLEIASRYRALHPPTVTDPVRVEQRHRSRVDLAGRLKALLKSDSLAAAAVQSVVEQINADHERLHEFLDAQNYRLAHWKTAGRELDYRRFFDITSLVGLCVEEEQVFDHVHALPIAWHLAGVVDAFRVDHPDGLRDPGQYLERLAASAPGAWIVVEKILGPGEPLRPEWPVSGTTGYDFMNLVGGLFMDPAAEAPLTDFYRRFTGEEADFPAVVYEKKHFVMRQTLAADVGRLAHLLLRICESHVRHRDHTRHDLHEAIREVVACFPVYRSYVRPEAGEVHEQDRSVVARAISQAMQRRRDIDDELLGFLSDLLLLEVTGELEGEFVMRFQQLTSTVEAKGVEDTAFYNYNRFISLNEVGGDPARWCCSPCEFHEAMALRQEEWPFSMNATSTHDSKRSEDVRARLFAVSEIAGSWTAAVKRWSALNEVHHVSGLPDRNMEYLLYQTLVGAHPLTSQRLAAFIEKAAREAKSHTSWVSVNEAYEQSLASFAKACIDSPAFRDDLATFAAKVTQPGRINSLAMTLIKLTAPGVPDIYQGCELWDLSLVDPDNRRPVDFDLRRQCLTADLSFIPAVSGDEKGLSKLFLIRRALEARQRNPEAFGGKYEPLEASGEAAGNVVAFMRGGRALTVIPRLSLSAGNRRGTRLKIPRGSWRNTFTGVPVRGGAVEVQKLFDGFPLALLEREDSA